MLTKIVTKKNVELAQKDLYYITINLILKEETTEVLNMDFSKKYRTGDIIGGLVNKFVKSIQEEIDAYKAEQVIYNHAQMDTAIINISARLTL